MSTSPLAFISYRRIDSSAAARWLERSIAKTFGAACVFIDTESIRMGDRWPARINEALETATVLIPVIGPYWLSCTDEHHQRRIDGKGDWVRKEIAYALKHQLRIMPVVLSGTPMPRPAALPSSIVRLADSQAFELRDERFVQDLNMLLDRLEQFGFKRLSPNPVRYPKPMVKLREFTATELKQALADLPGWQCLDSELPGSPNIQRTEFHKVYTFASFEDAISFMTTAAPGISQRQHHPRWENVWRSVSVWLSTWDIGHKPSELDVELTRYLDTVRNSFAPDRKGP